MRAENRYVGIGLAMCFAAAGCGSSAADVAASADEIVTVATTESAAVSTTELVATTEPEASAPEVTTPDQREYRRFGAGPLKPGWYQTPTVLPIQFQIYEPEGSRFAHYADSMWHADLYLGSELDEEPGAMLAVAEAGQTPAGVADSLIESAGERIVFERKDGVFRGLPAVILTGFNTATEVGALDDSRTILLKTGTESDMGLVSVPDRQYLIYIFAVDDWVVIVDFDAYPADFDQGLATFAPVFESLEFGESE